MANRVPRCKIPSPRCSPPPSAAAAAAAAHLAEAAPAQFLCPVSHSLMGDPVVVAATGWTFERSCVLACLDLGIAPPDLSLQLPSSSISSPPLMPVLIPNSTLKSAIHNWCDARGLPHPLPIPPDAARSLVRGLIPSDSPPSSSTVIFRSSPGGFASSDCGGKEKYEALGSNSLRFVPDNKKDQSLKVPALSSGSISQEDDTLGLKLSEIDINSEGSPENSPLCSSPFATSSSRRTSSSSSSSVEIENTKATILTCTDVDAFEDEILAKLTNDDIKEQEFAAISLRHATRENRVCRIKLCSRRLLAALRSMVLSSCAAVQINAVAAVVNLSLEPENKVAIVSYGVVLPLVDVLKHGQPEVREHAAAAFFSLALEEENRVPIGSLGAIPPLLSLFSCLTNAGLRARRDAGMALYYLSLEDLNRSKIAQTAGAVRALFAVAEETGEYEAATAIQTSPRRMGPGLPRLAMMVISHLAACTEGRSALMDAEAIAAVVALMRTDAAAMEEHCVAALYGMSRDRYRFPGLARAAGAERILMRVAEGGNGDVRRRMATKTLRAIRRQDHDETAPVSRRTTDSTANGNSRANSDWLVSFRLDNTAAGNGSDIKSAPF
ncbi:U-box domain-containing protein 38-like [Curcuma longa]|uniref:U-box domain-containing protein 38-like n=1 Tax=Curcuma longa TaxID=136217 RepID=UPI003D9EABBA